MLGGTLGGGLNTAPLVMFVAGDPREDVHVVGAVGLYQPSGGAGDDKVPHAAFFEVVGTWQEFVA